MSRSSSSDSRSFRDLLEKYGTPLLLINTPRSFPTPGGEEFLLVRAEIEVPRRKFGTLRARLKDAGYGIVRYYEWFSRVYYEPNRVRLTLAEDATPLHRAEVERAIAERRILNVTTESNMGDRRPEFWLLSRPVTLLPGNGFSFLFPDTVPGGIRDEDLPDWMDHEYCETAQEVFHHYRDRFTRDLPPDLPPEPPHPSPRPRPRTQQKEKPPQRPAGETEHGPPLFRPSAELSARIQERINAVQPADPAAGWSPGEWPARFCKEEMGALPIHSSSALYIWAIRPDGTVLRLDLDSVRNDVETEADPMALFTALVHGARRYPELSELVPPPPNALLCPRCGGTGIRTQLVSTGDSTGEIDDCASCNGTGWFVPDPQWPF